MRQHDIADRVSALVPVFACLLLLPSLGGAQPTATQNDLRRCAELVNEADRRACLDWVTRALRRDGGAREPPEEATDTAGPREATPPDENRDVDAFGAELIGGGAARGPDEIRSRLVGEFTGWRGNTEFTLENGQVWRQAERDRMIFSADAPIVTIRRGAFNAYRLTVEGVRRSIRVRRVR